MDTDTELLLLVPKARLAVGELGPMEHVGLAVIPNSVEDHHNCWVPILVESLLELQQADADYEEPVAAVQELR